MKFKFLLSRDEPFLFHHVVISMSHDPTKKVFFRINFDLKNNTIILEFSMYLLYEQGNIQQYISKDTVLYSFSKPKCDLAKKWLF